jgi:hypothetical protein
VVDLLRGPVLTGRARVYPRRWQITLGTDERGEAVRIPASQLNVAVCGGTGEGKSYLAGLICEQLVGLRYSLVVFDPEGDHVGLGNLPGRARHWGPRPPPARPDVVRLLRYATVVVDLSRLDATGQAAWSAGFPSEVAVQRAETGLPQWVVLDEAHGPLGPGGIGLGVFDPSAKGYLLVTWRPEELAGDVLASLDVVIALGSPHAAPRVVELAAAVADAPRDQIARLRQGPTGRAVLARRARPGQPLLFTVGSRSTPHLRHEHKYEQMGVDPAHRFYFRTEPDSPTGAIAANLAELEAELGSCDHGVLRHHCPQHDFSQWTAEVFHDQPLAANLAAAENQLRAQSPTAVVERVRLALIAALQARHPS